MENIFYFATIDKTFDLKLEKKQLLGNCKEKRKKSYSVQDKRLRTEI